MTERTPITTPALPGGLPFDATQVQFTPAGAGAVPRSVQSKERDVVSVLDFYANGVSGVPVDPTGVVDSTLGIQAAINTLGGGGILWFPQGTYLTTDEIVITGRSSVTLQGAGNNSTVISYNSATSNPAKGMIRITNASNCIVSGMLLRPKPAGLGGKLGFAVYITSNGASTTIGNRVENVQIQNASDAGIQIGHVTTDIDTTCDLNEVVDAYVSGCAVGVRVNDTNTNMTSISGGAITNSTVAGIEIGLGARGVSIRRVLMNANGNTNIWIRDQESGPISIRDMVTEISPGGEKFLTADISSGGSNNYNMLTLENVNVTNISLISGVRLIDYQGAGSVTIRNCRFGGAASTSGGAGATLYFTPSNTAQSGGQRLITEGVHLYDGASWSVSTDTSRSAYFRWLDIGTYSGGSSQDDVPTNSPVIRIQGGMPLEAYLLNTITLPAGVTSNNIGSLGRQCWKVTIDKTAWTAAATTQDIQFATLPAKARIVACYSDTTIAYTGLAGTIQLTINVASATAELIAAHDVKSAAVTRGLLDADLGANFTRAARIQDAVIPNWTATRQPNAHLASSVGNIGTGTVTNLTTGSTTIYLITETLP